MEEMKLIELKKVKLFELKKKKLYKNEEIKNNVIEKGVIAFSQWTY